MNFLIFRNFSHFFEFILDLFGILKLKKIILTLRADVERHRHVASCVHATWKCTFAYVCAHVCAFVRMYALVCVRMYN